MNILVCVKQVPDTTEIKINPKTNTLIRSGATNMVNPFDKHALEAAVQLKEQHGGSVTVLTMGPSSARSALADCLAVGADHGVLVSDMAFAGSDTYATAYILARAIKTLGQFDLILCGKQAIDGDTAQVGPALAEHLELPQLTNVASLSISGDVIHVQREQTDGYQVVEAHLPVLCTVVRALNSPRYPTILGKSLAKKMPITHFTAQNLHLDLNKVGLKGSPTKVIGTFTPPKKSSTIIIREATSKESAKKLLTLLTDAKII